MSAFLRLELGRSFRDLRYLVLAIVAPVGFYLLFAGIFAGRGVTEGELPSQVEIMVAMATFGAMWGALSACPSGHAATRGTGAGGAHDGRADRGPAGHRRGGRDRDPGAPCPT